MWVGLEMGVREEDGWERVYRREDGVEWGQSARTGTDRQTNHQSKVTNHQVACEKNQQICPLRKRTPHPVRGYTTLVVLHTGTQPDSDFEVANDSGKVRCIVCFANDNSEPWIHRSSATAHMKSERHNRSVAAQRQRTDEAARDSERWKEATFEMDKLFSNSFVPADTFPSVRVTKHEPTAVSSQLQTEEEEEAMRRVLRYLNDPPKDDPTSSPIHDWQRAGQSLEAQVAQVIAGNLAALGPDMGDDDFLEDVMSTARLLIPPSSLRPRCTDPTTFQTRTYPLMR